MDEAVTKPEPCPFCGAVGLDFSEGTTFRWRVAACIECGATTGEERIQTTGEGTQEEWEANVRERLTAAWNRRSPPSAPRAEAVEARTCKDSLTVAQVATP